MKNKTIAGYGVEQSFTYKAYTKSNLKKTHKYISYTSFKEVTQSLNLKQVDLIIIPVHNTTIGEIKPALEALEPYNFKEITEITIPIVHALIIHPSTNIENIDTVMSYKVALKQCTKNIKKHGWAEKEHADTAGAIIEVLEKGYKNIAAIGPIEAIFGTDAKIIYPAFNDKENNKTTFKIYENRF